MTITDILRSTSRIVGLFLIVVLGATEGFSQETFELTLEKAIGLALKHNQVIHLAEDDLDLTKQQIREAYSPLYPQIEGVVNYTRNIKSPVFFSNIAPEPIQIGNDNSFLVGVGLQQAIWLGGKLFTARDIAKLAAEGAKENIVLTKENTILDVTRTFYSVLLMQEMLKVTLETLESAKANFQNIVKLKQEGLASEFDSLSAGVRVAGLEPELIQARSNVKTVTNALKFLLNMDLGQPVEVVGELIFTPAKILDNETDFSLNNRRELNLLQIQKEIFVKLKKVETSNYFPSVFAVGNIQNQASSDDFDISDKENATIINAGLTISIPIFNGFLTSAKVQQAQVNINKIDRQLDLLTQRIKLEVENSRLKLKEAQERVFAQTQSVQQAEKALQIAKVRFQNGLSTQVELNDAETALARIKLSRLSAVYDYLIAKAEHEKALGLINIR
ncbi:MAG: TolC family protein [Calditrichaeota bacterium]|nr:TolC family protein [Calditrichota bacterium]MCB0267732.1 TolC family protein [Calditrichota bacterium]MCB0285008.1 TolC family protein [Calditrichota bacterium]